MSKKIKVENTELFSELKTLIETSKSNVAISVNAEMTMLYWNIGKRINQEVLQNERAEYGKQIVQTVSAQLMLEYGRGFSKRNLFNMMQFSEVFPDEKIVVSLIRQLSWSHIISLIPIKDSLKRDFYIEMCKMEKWSVRVLDNRMNSLLFERTAISKKGDETILQDIEQMGVR